MVKIGCEGDLDFEKRESSFMDGLPKNFLRQQPCENNTIYKVDTTPVCHTIYITKVSISSFLSCDRHINFNTIFFYDSIYRFY